MVYLGAANRDAARWEEPERFDFERERDRHMACGFGVHTCIGALLARLEAQAGLDALLDRLIAWSQGKVVHVDCPRESCSDSGSCPWCFDSPIAPPLTMTPRAARR